MNKHEKSTVLLTGAAGFLGSYLLKILLKNGHRVYALARGKQEKTAQTRVIELLTFWDEAVIENAGKNLEVVEGDIVYPDLGIKSKGLKEKLLSETGIIIHSAAVAKLREPLESIRKPNVEGTKNLLEFALQCKKIQKVNHISTCYVAGDKPGMTFTEDMLEIGQKFYNTYEQTKYEAELLVHEYRKKGLDISIFRPSMVMGDSKEGKTNDFRLIYEPLHFFSQGIYEQFPANPRCFQNLVNVDTVGNALYLLCQRKGNATYHLVSPNETYIGDFTRLAGKYFGFKMPEFIPAEKFVYNGWTPIQRALAEPYIPYFNYTTKFSSGKTQEVLKEYNYALPMMDERRLLKVLEYCNKRGFIHR